MIEPQGEFEMFAVLKAISFAKERWGKGVVVLEVANEELVERLTTLGNMDSDHVRRMLRRERWMVVHAPSRIPSAARFLAERAKDDVVEKSPNPMLL